MRRLALLLACLAALPLAADPLHKPATNVAIANNASCDIGIYPAATLLLPYFEVDFNAPQTEALNTVFSVVNVSPQPQIVRVTLWTDLGFPGALFNMFLTGYDAQTVSLYEIFAKGSFPRTSSLTQSGAASLESTSNPNFSQPTGCDRMGGPVTFATLARLQRIFTTGERDGECRVSTPHTNAVGYVTLDVVNSCSPISPLDSRYYREVLLFDNVLTGDYQRINPSTSTGNYAGGNPLVHIRAIPEGGKAGTYLSTPLSHTFYDRLTPFKQRTIDRRQPLPSVFAARYIEGGATSFQSSFAIWREGAVAGNASECAYEVNRNIALPVASVVRFDEHENATVLADCATDCAPRGTPAAASISTGSQLLPPLSNSGDVGGWFWVNLDNPLGWTEYSPFSSPRPSQAWIVVQMYAEGRYGVDFDATALANGCTANLPAQP